MVIPFLGTRYTYQSWVAHKLPSQPQEWLLEVIVRLCGNIVVLKVLLSVESDGLGLHFSLLHIDFVAAEDNWHLLADTDKVAY